MRLSLRHSLSLLLAPVSVAVGQTVASSPTAPSPAVALTWRTDRVGGTSPFYEVAELADSGRTLTLRRMEGGSLLGGEFGTATTSAPAIEMRGRRVTVRALIRTSDAESASIWVRAEGGGKTLRLENNMARALTGTRDWGEQTAVLDIPDETEKISYGLLIVGRGSISARNLTVTTGPIEGAARTGAP
ncbi:MAG: hypothetical protein ABJE47_01655 [bacterium]